jgi:hypothetical protein
MAKTKISEFSSTAASNTDIDGININEGCAPSGINDAIRELMSQLKDWQSGTSNDPYVIGSSGSLTLNQGTANGVAYLNGSKVVTSGSALTFDGTTLDSSITSGVAFRGTASTGTNNVRQQFVNTGGTFSVGLDSSTGGIFGAAYAGFMWHSGNYPLVFGQNNAEGMRLTSTGLGIGTSSPTRKLTVAATNASMGLVSADTGYSEIYFSDSAGSPGAISYDHNNDLMAFYTNNTSRLIINSSGNLGLGVTPSAWNSNYKGFQMNGGALQAYTSGDRFAVNQNAFVNSGGVSAYVNNGYASQYLQLNSEHRFYTAASGTAGNAISFTQAMTLDASGNLGVGATSMGTTRLVIRGDASTNFAVAKWSHSSNASSGFDIGYASSVTSNDISLWNYENGFMRFATNGSERARIDTSGNFMVGYSSAYNPSGGGTTRGTFALEQANRTNLVVSNQTNNSSAGAALVLAAYGADWILESGSSTKSSNSLTFTYGTTERARIDSSGNFIQSSTGNPRIYSQGVYNVTGGASANMVVGSDGGFYRSTSSLKYKKNVQDATHGLSKLIELRPVTYESKNENEAGIVYGGLIAEEVHATGLTEFVQYADDGTPDALAYGNMVSLCIKAIQEQQAIIVSLQARLDAANL